MVLVFHYTKNIVIKNVFIIEIIDWQGYDYGTTSHSTDTFTRTIPVGIPTGTE